MGARHPHRVDDGGVRRVARAAVARPPGALLRRDEACRVGRSASRTACCRRTSTRSIRTTPPCSRPRAPCIHRRSRATSRRTILHPPLAPLAKLVPPEVVYAVRPVLERIPIETYSWAMWPSVGLAAGRRARGVRVALGTARANGQRVAGRRLAGVASADPDRLALDAARSCSRPPGGRRVSRGAGSAARTATRG